MKNEGMKIKSYKKHKMGFLGAFIILVLLIFILVDTVFIIRNGKALAPSIETKKEAEIKNNTDATKTATDSNTGETNQSNTLDTSNTSGTSNPSDNNSTTTVNPDSSTSIEVPQTTDYGVVSGGNFDER